MLPGSGGDWIAAGKWVGLEWGIGIEELAEGMWQEMGGEDGGRPLLMGTHSWSPGGGDSSVALSDVFRLLELDGSLQGPEAESTLY